MQDVTDILVRLADRAGGTYVAALPEPVSHLAAFVLSPRLTCKPDGFIILGWV
jgi:hypothetical protein